MRRLAMVLLGLAAGCTRDKPPPPATGDTTLSAVAEPALTILSPQAQDRWTEGTRQVIRWRVTGISAINVGAAMGGKDKGHLVLNAPPEPDSLVWEIPVGFVTGFGLDSASDVRIRLENAADPTQFVDSEPFTILGKGRP
jgi:hypothetical protein